MLKTLNYPSGTKAATYIDVVLSLLIFMYYLNLYTYVSSCTLNDKRATCPDTCMLVHYSLIIRGTDASALWDVTC